MKPLFPESLLSDLILPFKRAMPWASFMGWTGKKLKKC